MIEALVSVLEPLEVCAYSDNNFIVCERIRRQIAGGGGVFLGLSLAYCHNPYTLKCFKSLEQIYIYIDYRAKRWPIRHSVRPPEL